MGRSRRLLVAAVMSGAVSWPATGAQVIIDFEPASGYTAGAPLAGQNGWSAVIADGGTAQVVVSGNGPTRAGGQCVELSDLAGSGGHEQIRVEKPIGDVISAGGPLVTLQYDVKILSLDQVWTEVGVPGLTQAHYWDTRCRWYGCREPAGTQPEWYDGPAWMNDGQWHTIRWTVLYGEHGDGQAGQLLSVRVDGDDRTCYAEDRNYLESGAPQHIDRVWLYLNDHPLDDGSNDVVWIDNIIVTGTPLPSAVPVADAGDDVTQSPGSWYGVVLDGGGSTDDGRIVRYRWTEGYGGPVLYDGREAAPLFDLGPGTHNLVLEVFDDTGLRDTDAAVHTIGPRPPIVDEVAGPWGLRNGDIHGTGASDRAAVQIGAGRPFEVLDILEWTDGWKWGPPADGSTFVVDYFGNLYYLHWCNYLESFTANLRHRWRGHDLEHGLPELRLGDAPVGNSALIAGIRYIYVVGGGDSADAGAPSVYAFEKDTGQMRWQTRLTGEDWTGLCGRAKVTLYNNKLYVVGHTDAAGQVNVFQLDATDGLLDWCSNVLVEMAGAAELNVGGVAFVPDANHDGKHYLLWNQMSAGWQTAGADGLADMVAIEIDPATGARTMWGPAQDIDGPGLEFSHPIYSGVTGRVYTPSYKIAGYWPSGLYAWSPTAGYLAASPGLGSGQHHGGRDAFALDFDGRTIHAAGESDTFCSYTDRGDGTFDVVYRTFGGYAANGYGFYGQGALLRDERGHSVYYTATKGDPGNPAAPAKVVALDLSEPANPGGNTPLAEWVCQEWDAGLGGWNYVAPQMGPIPGPDGSVYIAQARGYEKMRLVRLGRHDAPSVGACCVHSTCTAGLTPAACAALGGTFEGAGTTCGSNPCSACYADADCSGEIDFDDINYFVAALAGGESGWASYYAQKHGGAPPPCTFWNCDANGSGAALIPPAPAVDFDDINAFVAKLVTPPVCP
jgi:hypothetical protein